MDRSKVPAVLSIAGSDSSGGAGIQADLKTIAAHRLYGESAITALTAQNTCGVTGVLDVPPAFVAQQIDAVFDESLGYYNAYPSAGVGGPPPGPAPEPRQSPGPRPRLRSPRPGATPGWSAGC